MKIINVMLKLREGHTLFDMCCNQIEHCIVLQFKWILQFEYCLLLTVIGGTGRGNEKRNLFLSSLNLASFSSGIFRGYQSSPFV
jgi:hypothetical protein